MIYLDPALVAGEVDDEILGLVEIVRPVARDPLLAGHFARLFACLTASHSDCLAREENLICSLVYILRQHGMGRPTSSGPSAQLLGPPSEPRSIKGPKPYQMKACWGPLAPSLNFTATALLSNGLWNSGLRRPRLHLLPGQRHVFARHDFFHPVSPKMIRRTSPQAGRLHLIDEGSVSVGFKIRTGIILSGGPSSVFAPDASLPDKTIFELGVPVLGICFGLQLFAHFLGGKVEKGLKREYGKGALTVKDSSCALFAKLPRSLQIG